MDGAGDGDGDGEARPKREAKGLSLLAALDVEAVVAGFLETVGRAGRGGGAGGWRAGHGRVAE